MEEERFVSTSYTGADENESSLRPRTMHDYIGQEKIKDNLSVFIEAARGRGEPLDHVLLYGPPGLGKTTLAGVIAAEMNVQIRTTSGPAIEKPGDLAALLTNLNEGDILFIDEIHRLSSAVEEVLYPALEDFALDIIIGKGPSARSIRLDLKRFTLIGATTRAGSLTGPLRDRFGMLFRLELYSPQELTAIIKRSAGILNVPIEEEGARELARRSRGTPRIANRFLRRIRDFAQIYGNILRSIAVHFGGGPVGLETLAATTGEDAVTIEDVYEPYLLQIGFLSRTPRGRCITPRGCAHIGVAFPGADQPTLF